jgi:hypothetical protein
VGIVDSQSRYGRQPFVKVLDSQGRTISGTGRLLGFDGGYFLRVGRGRTAPSEDMRRAVSEFLGIGVEELFTPEALEAEYQAPANARGLRAGTP